LPLADGLLHSLVDLLQIDVEVHQDGGGNALALANQSQEDVLRAHVIVLEPDGLLPCHRQDLPDTVREVVIHGTPRRPRRLAPEIKKALTSRRPPGGRPRPRAHAPPWPGCGERRPHGAHRTRPPREAAPQPARGGPPAYRS